MKHTGLYNVNMMTIEDIKNLSRHELIYNTFYGSILAYADFPATFKEATTIIANDEELMQEVTDFINSYPVEDIYKFSFGPNVWTNEFIQAIEEQVQATMPTSDWY